MTTIRKTYVSGPYGQIHVRQTLAVPSATPLICLHATAYSSQSFLPLMRAMRGKRQIIAIDAPGYGESDTPPEPISMGEYAAATLAALDQLVDRPAEILGYHTGCYAATEMAIARPEQVASLVLIGVPYFQALDVGYWKAKLAARHNLTDSLDQFSERWAYFVSNRDSSVSLERGFANFIDELKAWPNGWWAHDAMFAYDSAARLPMVRQSVRILNPAGHLAAASRAAGALMPNCAILELPELTGPVLENSADQIARYL